MTHIKQQSIDCRCQVLCQSWFGHTTNVKKPHIFWCIITWHMCCSIVCRLNCWHNLPVFQESISSWCRWVDFLSPLFPTVQSFGTASLLIEERTTTRFWAPTQLQRMDTISEIFISLSHLILIKLPFENMSHMSHSFNTYVPPAVSCETDVENIKVWSWVVVVFFKSAGSLWQNMETTTMGLSIGWWMQTELPSKMHTSRIQTVNPKAQPPSPWSSRLGRLWGWRTLLPPGSLAQTTVDSFYPGSLGICCMHCDNFMLQQVFCSHNKIGQTKVIEISFHLIWG